MYFKPSRPFRQAQPYTYGPFFSERTTANQLLLWKTVSCFQIFYNHNRTAFRSDIVNFFTHFYCKQDRAKTEKNQSKLSWTSLRTGKLEFFDVFDLFFGILSKGGLKEKILRTLYSMKGKERLGKEVSLFAGCIAVYLLMPSRHRKEIKGRLA